MAEDKRVEELIKDYQTLKGQRGTWNSHWQEIAERVLPSHKHLFFDLTGTMSDGEKRNQEIFDSTATLALDRFSAILDSLLTPRNSFWHRLKPSDEVLGRNKTVQDYFHKLNKLVFEQRYAPKANFSSQNQQQYKSLGAYGTGAMFVDDLQGLSGLRYKNIHLSELYMQENHQGVVDRVCREFTLSARKAYQRFGDALPKQIIEQLKIDSEKEYLFLHWVLPREDKEPFRADFKGMDFASYFISMEGRVLLEEGGYVTFPYAVSRYEQSPNEAYGRSIAMNVLPAIKTLNEQKKTLLKQGHLAVDPVILAHDDGILDIYDAYPGSMIPGGVSKDGRPLVQPMPTGRVDIGLDMMQEERALINDSFLVTLFQILVETPQATATEILERSREKGILLAPTIGRQQSEYLGPMVEREIDILSRQGILPEMPAILLEAQGDYEIVYEGPLTRSQRAEEASGMMRTVQQLLEVAGVTGEMSLLDHINWDAAIPEMAEIHGTPSTWLNSPDKIALMRQQREQQQQAQQAIEAAPAVAGLAKAQQG